MEGPMTIWSNLLSLHLPLFFELWRLNSAEAHAKVHQKALRNLPARVAQHQSTVRGWHFADCWSPETAISAEVDARGGELPASGA